MPAILVFLLAVYEVIRALRWPCSRGLPHRRPFHSCLHLRTSKKLRSCGILPIHFWTGTSFEIVSASFWWDNSWHTNFKVRTVAAFIKDLVSFSVVWHSSRSPLRSVNGRSLIGLHDIYGVISMKMAQLSPPIRPLHSRLLLWMNLEGSFFMAEQRLASLRFSYSYLSRILLFFLFLCHTQPMKNNPI